LGSVCERPNGRTGARGYPIEASCQHACHPKPAEPEAPAPANLIPHAPPAPAPALDPDQAADKTWFRMNNNAEPFDPALLEKLYAAILRSHHDHGHQ